MDVALVSREWGSCGATVLVHQEGDPGRAQLEPTGISCQPAPGWKGQNDYSACRPHEFVFLVGEPRPTLSRIIVQNREIR